MTTEQILHKLDEWLLDRLQDLKTPPQDVVKLGFCEAKDGTLVENCGAILAQLVLARAKEPPAQLLAWGRALRPDGLLLATTFGAETGMEWREAGIELPHWPDVRDVGNALNKLGFALPVVDSSELTLTFTSLVKLWETLEPLGVLPDDMPDELESRTDGLYAFTLEILTLTAYRPAAGQPVVLKPGAFSVGLDEVLKG